MNQDHSPFWPIQGSKKGGLDQEALFGVYAKSEERKQKMNDKILRKAFNIPLDDDVNVDQRKYGVGAGGLLALALGLGIPGLGAIGAGTWLLSKFLEKQAPPAVAPADPSPAKTTSPITQRLRVTVDGENISVTPIEEADQPTTKAP